jgi:hypothetical protein
VEELKRRLAAVAEPAQHELGLQLGVCVNRTQARVNRTQVCVNRTQARVNRTQALRTEHAATRDATQQLIESMKRSVDKVRDGHR